MFSCAAKREHVCLTDGVQFCLHPLFWVSSCFMYLLVHVFYVLACWEIILAQQCTVDLKAHTCSLAFCMNWKPRWGGGIVMQLMLHFIVSYLTALKLKTGGKKTKLVFFWRGSTSNLNKLHCEIRAGATIQTLCWSLFRRDIHPLQFFFSFFVKEIPPPDQMSERFKVECREIPLPTPT